MGAVADRLLQSDEPYGGYPEAAWRGIDWGGREQQTLVAGGYSTTSIWAPATSR